MESVPSREKCLSMLKELGTPIDFPDLIAKGVLKKQSGGWYKVLKVKELPPHAKRQAYQIEFGPKGLRLKFENPAKAARLYQNITGKPLQANSRY